MVPQTSANSDIEVDDETLMNIDVEDDDVLDPDFFLDPDTGLTPTTSGKSYKCI